MSSMKPSAVVVYTTRYCPYCFRAKALLDSKSVAYKEIPVDGKPDLREKMTRLSGGAHTVPQIWVGDYHVGGCDELYMLERRGNLDPLLAGEPI